ncbi:NmrA family transcriptional regulator [Spirillospora sp. CA-294931]|uniref:NmrA family transcriptional regulator n=1 Tax=Spirillospora sp. CA-294931 TaxID=3240042 RepID=UPI003D93CDB5
MTNDKLTLVLGGTGKTGRRVAGLLEERGLPVRIGSRSADPSFDWDAPETWPTALDGVAAVYVAFYPDLSVPGAPETISAFTTAAVDAGVERIVLLTARGEKQAQECERIVLGADIDATVVRASWFFQNFSESEMAPRIVRGRVVLPVGDVPEPFLDAGDIAEVAVLALTEDGHAGKVHELTGTRTLTWEEAVAEIASALGKEIDYVRCSPEEFAAGLEAEGFPPEVAGLVTYLYTDLMDGRNTAMTDDLARLLGRAPRDFSDFARDAVAAGTWKE